MKLTAQQRAGIAALLGSSVCRDTYGKHYLEFHAQGTYPVVDDNGLMVRILERIAGIQTCGEQKYEVEIEWSRFECCWDIRIRFEATEYVGGNHSLPMAVVLAALTLPESSPPAREQP